MKQIIFNAVKKRTIIVIFIIIAIGFGVYLNTLPGKILGKIIDLLPNMNENKALIYNNLWQLLACSLLIIVSVTSWRYLLIVLNRGVEKDVRLKIFEHLTKMEFVNMQNIKNGELMTYFTKDLREIRGFIYTLFGRALRIIFVIAINFYAMKSVNTKLAIITSIPLLITIFLSIYLKKYIDKSFKKAQKHFTNLSEYVQESTDAIRTTKAYSGETNQLKKFIKKNKILKKSNISVDISTTLLSTSVSLCIGICYSITLLYGSKLVLDNIITVGSLVTFITYIELIANPIKWFPQIISKTERTIIAYNRLKKVYEIEEEKIFLEDIDSKERISGDIEIKDLTFNYPGNLDNVLKNISLKIKQGETLGIIGTIGSGKTTLVNLLLNLYKVPKGKITINNQDINDIDITTLRNSISYITQDNFLFSTTIKENIRLFKDIFDDDKITESTKKSKLADDFERLGNGIETVIGERGVDLSGGQKQRVIISRAFLNKSNFIIFDDSFSALDNKTEEAVLENIKELVKDKTCIIISNRISDVKFADNIIVLNEGTIVESGKHEELLEKNGLYTKFYNRQASKEESLLA